MISRLLKTSTLTLALLSASVGHVAAQSGFNSAACATEGAIRCHVLVERRTEADSTIHRTSVLALWRSSPHDIPATAQVDSTEAVRMMTAYAAAVDSVRALGLSHFGHGSIYGHSHVTVKRRPGGSEMLATLPDSAFVSHGAFRVPEQDSTLVLLVDGLERIGYQPAVIAFHYPSGRITRELDAWLTTIRGDPRIGAFLERTP